MKIVPGNVNRTVVTRVIVAWAALSLLAGTVAFYVELERGNRSVFELTINESKRFSDTILLILISYQDDTNYGILCVV